ncbi:MAG: Gfo/Idh/MocA family oxidoreductase [Acidobacteria bacterium]|nr:Gfo/Idh/MocA family oxidoreductase [Acidobacteriota bacterium]
MNINLAVVGLGRMGQIHALHARQVADEIDGCRLVALVDRDLERARSLAEGVAVYPGVDELIASGVANAAVVCTPTAHHQEHATKLIEAGLRVLLEKPMTLQLATDREFAAMLDVAYPRSLMLAFQRRFDPPLQYAKNLLDQGKIGRCFKIVSALEDSGPAPATFRSGGILKDMSVHNVDEVLWFTGRLPDCAASGGSSVCARRIQPETEDEYDDGFIRLWFGDDAIAEVQVTRNHVSGYRIETWIFGTEGQIHIGRFEQDRHKVLLEAYGRQQVIERKEFVMPNYGDALPEFVHRFGPAYKEEVHTFVRCCVDETPFPISHKDGLRAMEIIAAAQQCRWTRESAQALRWQS